MYPTLVPTGEPIPVTWRANNWESATATQQWRGIPPGSSGYPQGVPLDGGPPLYGAMSADGSGQLFLVTGPTVQPTVQLPGQALFAGQRAAAPARVLGPMGPMGGEAWSSPAWVPPSEGPRFVPIDSQSLLWEAGTSRPPARPVASTVTADEGGPARSRRDGGRARPEPESSRPPEQPDRGRTRY